MTKATLLKLSAMVLSLGLMAGCASEQMKADILKAQQTADSALSAANDAKATAASAESKADAAMDAANAAKQSADEANERADRMMQKCCGK